MGDKPRILIVDDTPTNVVILRGALTKAGYEPLAAGNGHEAVELATGSHPDLVLLDMVMPDQDGLETCRILKSQESTACIPIIFVTAHADTASVVKAFAAGACDYVTKPFTIDEILARVSVQLRLRAAERSLVEKNAQLEAMSRRLAETNHELTRQGQLDPLTNLLNRRAWGEAAELHGSRSRRYGHIYSVLMIDIDHFKSLNDDQGHPAGDEALCRVARSIASTCRATDSVGRYGGEEFAVLAPHTPLDAAATLADRIRQAVWNLAVPHRAGPAGRATVSIGVASSGAGSLAAVISLADASLYLAKKGGRNRVHAEPGAVPAAAVRCEVNAYPKKVGTFGGPDEGRVTVLVVDDEPTNRRVCAGCLSREGYLIREAHNGREAIAEVERHPPDVILMDVMMPEMDGLTCVRHLKANPSSRDIPVIVVSTLSEPENIVAGFEAGAEEYLIKPVRTTELLARVRSMVRLQRERKDLLRSYHLRAEQIHILMVLLDFCRRVGEATSRDAVLEGSLDALAEITGGRRISILLPDAERGHLVIAKSMGIDEMAIAGVRIPIGAGIAGRVFETRKPIMINEATEVPRDPDPYDAAVFAGVPLLSAPLATTGETLGVLNVTDRVAGRPFEGRELEYIELIAGITGSALHAHSSRQSRDEARDLIMIALAKLAEHRDTDTARHVERVTQYAIILAQEMSSLPQFQDRIDDDFINCMRRAVPLHDIGKVAIPDSILRKPGRLTVEEMTIMKTHTEVGAETLRPVLDRAPQVSFLKMAYDIVRSHHEWYDGSGYPAGLSGSAIPLAARIVALADVYDALTTKRVYKDAVSPEEAVGTVMRLARTQFDPAVVDAFLRRQHEFKRLAITLGDSVAPCFNIEIPAPSLTNSRTTPVSIAHQRTP